MLKCTFRTPVVTFQLEADNQVDMFKTISDTQEVFGEMKCGLCEGHDLRFAVRTVNGDDYHELVCNNPKCRAKLSFGCSKQKKGTLFPIRKLTEKGKPSRKDGKYGQHNGWTKYRGEKGEKPADTDE